MSEYTLNQETSVQVVMTAADLLGISQVGVYKKATTADLTTYVGGTTPSAVTFTGSNTFNAGAVFSGVVNISNIGFSTLIGTTASSKVGFWGAAGTSQRTSGAQVTMTLSSFTGNTQGNICFTSTAQASLLWGQVAEIRQTLVDMGVWNGS